MKDIKMGIIDIIVIIIYIIGIIDNGLGIPFMVQAWWLFCINCVIYYVVSYLTPKPDPIVIAECTWTSPISVITQGKF